MSVFPSSPTDGQIVFKGSIPYQYSAANNAWSIIVDPNLVASNIKSSVSILGVIGTLQPQYGNIYLAVNDWNINFGSSTGGFGGGQNLFSVNVGNTIYSFGYGYLGGYKLLVLYSTLDNSAYPVRGYASLPYTISPSYSITSVYLDGTKIYFNGSYSGSNPHYDYFDTVTKTFTTNQTGSHTTGTLINSALQLNGFQYDPNLLTKSDSGTLWADIQTKVTKL